MSRMTEEGQVTIPEEVRDKLGIRPGDEVEFVRTDDGYRIEKVVAQNPFEKWRGAAETDGSVEERMAELRGER